MPYNFLRASHVKNKTVLLRVDMNEEVVSRGKLADDFRIRAILPTIQFLQEQGAKIIICSHVGRPEGKHDKKFTLQPMAECLAELLDYKFIVSENKISHYGVKHVIFLSGDITKSEIHNAVKESDSKDIIVLENLRFYPGEEENNSEFAKHLADLAEVYVDDAFAVAHRKAASIVAITKFLPSYVGPLLEKEIKNLDFVLNKAQHPFVLMMGGIKISDKAKTLQNLGRTADQILLGGGIANLLLAASGLEVGDSKIEAESKHLAWNIANNFKHKIVLPKDVVVSNKSASPGSARVKNSYDVKPNESMYDIGPKTILEFSKILKQAKTICWNGPMGRFEQKPFHTGTAALARLIGALGKRKTFVVAGGGETVAAIRQAHQEEHVDHLSTGGGAILEYLAGNKLPGLEALKK